ncbi:MAG: hypothetical protein JOZ02_23800 [Acidobacteria bacterium]|nr:hypothetical protein [Acidobacteriota bacterium]
MVDLSGRVVAATQPTPWRSEELLDTGRTFHEVFATPRKPTEAAPSPQSRPASAQQEG